MNFKKEDFPLVVLSIVILVLMTVTLSMQLDLQQQLGLQSSKISSLMLSGNTVNNLQSNNTPVQVQQSPQTQQLDTQALMQELIPRGIPEVYGSELGVSFEQPVESLSVLAGLDGDLYDSGLLHFADLSSEQQQRYITAGQSISCEFCCGAKYIVASDGKPACGCAHSAAMRGLTMYLLLNHENDFSDMQILDELTKWKVMFFPKQMLQKAIDLQAANSGITTNGLNELPDMVGGC
ncbi:MAG: hypothetical protein ABH821_04820 [archaeon]